MNMNDSLFFFIRKRTPLNLVLISQSHISTLVSMSVGKILMMVAGVHASWYYLLVRAVFLWWKTNFATMSISILLSKDISLQIPLGVIHKLSACRWGDVPPNDYLGTPKSDYIQTLTTRHPILAIPSIRMVQNLPNSFMK